MYHTNNQTEMRMGYNAHLDSFGFWIQFVEFTSKSRKTELWKTKFDLKIEGVDLLSRHLKNK